MKSSHRSRRCTDDDSLQSANAAAPVFASVHRPRHAGISAIKSNGMLPSVKVPNSMQQQQQQQQQSYHHYHHQEPSQQRPTYQQYQQQRRLHQQKQQQHTAGTGKSATQQLLPKGKNNWHEPQPQPQSQQHLSCDQAVAMPKQSIVLSAPPTSSAAAAGKQQMAQINVQQQRHHYRQYDVSPTKTSRIPVQQQQLQLQQQQLQQQQPAHVVPQQNFNQISKTATHLLNGIYERHLLSQTTFRDNEQLQQLQQQQQQQQRHIIGGRHTPQTQPQTQTQMQQSQWPPGGLRVAGVGELNLSNYATNAVGGGAHPHLVPIHVGKCAPHLKLPPPPPLPPHVVQQRHFAFTEGGMEPRALAASGGRKHFLLESLPLPPPPPPPPPAPLNHVYETIKERRPLPTPPPPPPPPPERQRIGTLEKAHKDMPPPPPARRPSRRSTSAGHANGRAAKNNSSNKNTTATIATTATHATNATNATNEAEHIEAKKQPQQQHAKMLPATQAALCMPPPAASKQQFNMQQRTRGDGEQQRQQQPLYGEQLVPKINTQQQMQQQQQQQKQQTVQSQHSTAQHKQKQHASAATQRVHPLGASEPTKKQATTTAAHPALFPAVAVDGTSLAPALTALNCNANSVQQQAAPTVIAATATTPHNPNAIAMPMPMPTMSTPHSNYNRPTALPIVFEEETGEFQDVLVLEEDGNTAKLPYRHGKIEVRLETAQAMAAAAYYARAAQKLAQSGSTRTRSTEMSNSSSATRNGGFCGALQRTPPPMPTGLARRLANKENFGIGKVKVMLRVSDTHSDTENPHFMSVDKKKRQVTLMDPTAAAHSATASTSQERGPMVAAPKMFAFDSLFTAEDQQSDVCASALSEVIPAVLEGSDGCLLTIGYPSSGQKQTMLGGVNPPSELGAIPCAISWLYKGINERRQKSGARFSVRVSALGVSATKPDSSSKDLLAAHATESDDSPGVYLRDDFLGGPTELRAPTAERAALFLDAALAGRPHSGLEPAMIFTLHVYQYSLSRKGGVAGGRSRLHLIDLGGCANRNGGLPLSGIGNILLAILSGQRHPPNKDHPLTPLLKDCLAPLTCHVAIMAHVTHTQSHTDALTTIQLASRIHRMRRRKHRFPMPSDKAANGLSTGLNGGHQSTGSSAGSGADPSSSELSADTVIYMGPSDDATDGEHPPVYLPSLSSGDNRGVMSKVLKGSGLEKQQPAAKTSGATKKTTAHKGPQSPVIANRTGSLKRGHASSPTPQSPLHAQQQQPAQQATTTGATGSDTQFYSPAHSVQNLTHSASSPKIVAGSLRHPGMVMMASKGSNVPSPKGSPLRRPGVGCGVINAVESPLEAPGSPLRKLTEEQWIDGPRVSRAKVAEARHMLREVNHVKQCETWIDGPKSQSSRSLTVGNLPTAPSQVQGYGFMDSHKKSMIRQWVENQTTQVFQSASASSSPTHAAAHRDQQAQHLRNITYHMSQLKQKSLDATDDLYANSARLQASPLNPLQAGDQHSLRSLPFGEELLNSMGAGLTTAISTINASATAEIRSAHATLYRQGSAQAQFSTSGPLNEHLPNPTKDETDLHSTHSLRVYGAIAAAQQLLATSASDTGPHGGDRQAELDEDQDSGPSEVPPALPLIEPLGSREISHESLHRIISRHVSRESLYQQQQQQQQAQELRRQEETSTLHSVASRQSLHSTHHVPHHSSMGMSDCGLQVTEEEIARTMGSDHPLAALSHCDNMSIVSSFNMAGDAFSDCAMGERTRNQFDQLARLREIFTSQLAMAEVTPVFRSGCDVGSVYSEPAYRFNTGPGSVCSEPPYRPPSPRQLSRSPSQGSLPSLNGIMQIAGMEQYASLRHPDGASDPNLPKVEKPAFVMEHEDICEVDEKSALLSPSKRPSLEEQEQDALAALHHLKATSLPIQTNSQTQLPLLPLNTSSEAYDSGHDSSTPRTSKHSGISRRAESGYHSVATARDSDESSFTSGLSKEHHNRISVKKKRQDKGLCNWLMNPFTCTYPETEGEISDF